MATADMPTPRVKRECIRKTAFAPMMAVIAEPKRRKNIINQSGDVVYEIV